MLIVDDRGYAHYYAHLQTTPTVSPGQRFQAGGVIGQVGNTGSIAQGGPTHLHYQVWEIGSGRGQERATGIYTRRFGNAVNPHPELERLARGIGAQVSPSGRAVFHAPG